MALGSIVVDLLLKTGAFETDTKKAERRLREMEKTAKQVGAVLGTAIVAGATAATVAIKGSIDAMDDMSKAALRAQMPTEDFSQLAYAGSLADVSMQDLTSSMGRLARAQSDAQRGLKTQADAFDSLGVAVTNADGTLRSSREVFLDVADAFERQQGSPEALAAGMQIFGRSFQNLIPLLKDGRAGLEAAADEADRLGITLSTEAGQQAEEFNDNLTRLKTAALGLSQSVAIELLPRMIDLTERMLEATSEGTRLAEIANDVGNAFDVMGSIFGTIGSVIDTVGDTVEGMTMAFIGAKEAAAGFLSLDWDRFKAGQAVVAEARGVIAGGPAAGPAPRQVNIIRPGDRTPNSILNPLEYTPTPPKPKESKAKAGKSDEQIAAERLESAYESMNQRLDQQIVLYDEASEAARVRYEIEKGSLQGLAPEKQALLIQDAEHLDLLNEIAQHEEIATRAAEEHAAAIRNQQERVGSLLSDMQFEIDLLGLSNQERERAIALRYANVDAASAEGQAIMDMADALIHERDQMEDQVKAMDALRDSSRSFLEDLRDGVDPMDALTEAAGRFIDTLWEIAANNLIEQAFGKQGSSGGGAWGDMIGGFFGSLFGGARAGGGPVDANRAYLVGEKGPELIVPRASGTVVPAMQTAAMLTGGGSGVAQTNHFHYAAPYDSRTEQQVAQRIAFETDRAQRRNR